MRTLLSRAMVTLAAICLEEKHRAWGIAMRAELEEAIDAKKPLRFAFGCLALSLRRMPTHEEGRFRLTAYVVALGLMLPMATFHIGCAAFGLPYFVPSGSISAQSSTPSMLLTSAHNAAFPSLVIITLVLGAGQIRMAWLTLDRDWKGVAKTGALTLAATITIIAIMALLYLNVTQALLQAAILTLELAVLVGLARWHAELPQPPQSHQATV